MAPKAAPVSPLAQGDVESLVEKSATGRALPQVVLPLLETSGSDEVSRICVCTLIYVRSGGFMLIVPDEAEVTDYLTALGSEGDGDGAAFHSCSVEVETARGQTLGVADVCLVDLPWDAVSAFFPGTALKQSKFKQAAQLCLSVDGKWARPNRISAEGMAENWISSEMDEAAAQDYHTAAEDEPAVGTAPAITGPLAGRRSLLQPPRHPAGDSDGDVAALQRRITGLELALHQRDQSQPGPSSNPTMKTPPLFNTSGRNDVIRPEDLSRLQQLAGAPPPRVASAETRRGQVSSAVDQQDHLLAEMEKEAEETQVAELGIDQIDGTADPMSQILLAQLQQNALLLKKLVGPRHADPIVGLLSGSSDPASGSAGGSGVKGCLAREAFIKASLDLPLIAQTVRRNALTELGLPAAREDGNLMRKYMERRMPLSDHKTLAYVATLCAEGWDVAFASQNIELMGVLGKILIFLEQAAIDAGKLQLAWLLTGHQEPAWQILVSHRRHPGLQPFSRLASPSWVTANLAYLKELDYLDTRKQSLTKLGPVEKADRDAEPKPKSKAKPKKGAGKGKRAEAAQEAEAES